LDRLLDLELSLESRRFFDFSFLDPLELDRLDLDLDLLLGLDFLDFLLDRLRDLLLLLERDLDRLLDRDELPSLTSLISRPLMSCPWNRSTILSMSSRLASSTLPSFLRSVCASAKVTSPPLRSTSFRSW
jgi:hypothetical protein